MAAIACAQDGQAKAAAAAAAEDVGSPLALGLRRRLLLRLAFFSRAPPSAFADPAALLSFILTALLARARHPPRALSSALHHLTALLTPGALAALAEQASRCPATLRLLVCTATLLLPSTHGEGAAGAALPGPALRMLERGGDARAALGAVARAARRSAGLALPQALQAELALALGGLAAPREAAGGGALLRRWVGVALRLAAVTPGENAGARAGRAQLAEELEGCWQG